MTSIADIPEIVLVSFHPHDLPTDLKNRTILHEPYHEVPPVIAVSQHPHDLPPELKARSIQHDTHREELFHHIPELTNPDYGTDTPHHMLPANIRSRMIHHTHTTNDVEHGDSFENGIKEQQEHLRHAFNVLGCAPGHMSTDGGGNSSGKNVGDVPEIQSISVHEHDLPQSLKDRVIHHSNHKEEMYHHIPEVVRKVSTNYHDLPNDLKERQIRTVGHAVIEKEWRQEEKLNKDGTPNPHYLDMSSTNGHNLDRSHLSTRRSAPAVSKISKHPHDLPHDLKQRQIVHHTGNGTNSSNNTVDHHRQNPAFHSDEIPQIVARHSVNPSSNSDTNTDGQGHLHIPDTLKQRMVSISSGRSGGPGSGSQSQNNSNRASANGPGKGNGAIGMNDVNLEIK